MGVTHYRPAFPSKAFRRLPLLFLATLALLSCDFFDIFPPEIEIVSPEEGTSYFATLPVEVKATDNRKVTKVEVFLDGESVHEFTKSPYKTDISLDQYSAASVNLKAIAHDQAGNSADASRDVNVTIGLRLTVPNGGETWAEQSSQTITWESSGSVGSTVGLHYSTDGGSTWDEITTSTANDGSHSWTLPNFSETQSACKIKVSTSQYADDSDDTFTISAESNTLTLTAPNGGETWAEQSTQTITWTYSGDVGDYVSLDYSPDGGATWTQIVSSTGNDGSHSWTLPNLLESVTTCRIKVASTTTSYADTSDANFTISAEPNHITIISPNGGESWPEQSTHDITWTRSGDVGDNVSLHFTLDGGGTWTQIIASTSNDGSHPWTLPNLFETAATCRVIVSSTSTSFADTSDADFTITAEPNYITLTSPDGGETWPEQSTHTITWESSGEVGSTVSLHYSTNSGASWTQITGSTANDGSHSWTLPNLIETKTTCRVKVASISANCEDISNGNFTILWGPTLVGYYNYLFTESVFISGHYAFIAASYGLDLRIVDISDPTSPSQAGAEGIGWAALGVFVSGNYAYLATARSGLKIVDISDPTSPSLAGSYETPGWALDCFVSNSYAYIADLDTGLLIIDISDPTSPSLAGSIDIGSARGVFVSGSYAYVATAWSGLKIVDISDPTSPSLAGEFYTDGAAMDVFISGSYAYVADGNFRIIDISDPTSPSQAGAFDTDGGASGVFVSGSYAYVADYAAGLQIINISEIASPNLVGHYNTPGYARAVFIDGNYAYVADFDSGFANNTGLLIFNISELP